MFRQSMNLNYPAQPRLLHAGQGLGFRLGVEGFGNRALEIRFKNSTESCSLLGRLYSSDSQRGRLFIGPERLISGTSRHYSKHLLLGPYSIGDLVAQQKNLGRITEHFGANLTIQAAYPAGNPKTF